MRMLEGSVLVLETNLGRCGRGSAATENDCARTGPAAASDGLVARGHHHPSLATCVAHCSSVIAVDEIDVDENARVPSGLRLGRLAAERQASEHADSDQHRTNQNRLEVTHGRECDRSAASLRCRPERAEPVVVSPRASRGRLLSSGAGRVVLPGDERSDGRDAARNTAVQRGGGGASQEPAGPGRTVDDIHRGPRAIQAANRSGIDGDDRVVRGADDGSRSRQSGASAAEREEGEEEGLSHRRRVSAATYRRPGTGDFSPALASEPRARCGDTRALCRCIP